MREYPIANGDKVEKYHIALLFNKGTAESPIWVQLAKAQENSISLNAETEDVEFIVDKNPTTLIKKYKPSLNNPLTLFKGEEDYDYFFNTLFYNLPTGAAADSQLLIVYMNEKVAEHQYKAWKCGCTFVLDNIDPVNSQLTCTTNCNGTIDRGTVTITNGVPAFESDEDGDSEVTVTITVSYNASPVSNASVMLGGLTKTTGTDGKVAFTLLADGVYALGATDGTHDYAEVYTAPSSSGTKAITLA